MHPATRNWLILPRSDPESGQLRHDCPRQSRSNVSSLTCDFRPLTSATCILVSAFSILFSAFWSLHSLLTPITFLLFAALLGSCTHSTPPPPPPLVGLDTTDHSIVWEVDSVGDGNSSVLYDVAIINDTTVWAVGDLYLGDSSGQLDPERYNLAKWDGLSWRLERVYYPYQGSLYLSQLHTIWAFNVSNVWVGSNQPMHWNGVKWTTFDITSDAWTGWIYKMWSNASGSLYIVGSTGALARFNGSTWTKLESGTACDLLDIWGTGDDDVWISGYDRSNYQSSVLLHGVNGVFEKRYEYVPPYRGERDDSLTGLVTSIWTDSKESVWALDGGTIWELSSATHGEGTVRWNRTEEGGLLKSIRGRAQNDIFVAGAYGELGHFNGASWLWYKQFFDLNGDLSLKSVTVGKSLVVAVGSANDRGVVIRGRQR